MAEIRSNMGTATTTTSSGSGSGSGSGSSSSGEGGAAGHPARRMAPTRPGFLYFDRLRARLQGTHRWQQPLGRVFGAVMFTEPTVALLEPELVRQVGSCPLLAHGGLGCGCRVTVR